MIQQAKEGILTGDYRDGGDIVRKNKKALDCSRA